MHGAFSNTRRPSVLLDRSSEAGTAAHTSHRLHSGDRNVRRRHCTAAQGGGRRHSSQSRPTPKWRRALNTPQATSTMADPKTSTQVQDSEPAAFDWRNQWYPVHFARDLPEGQPQRVYIFDEPIVVLKRPGDQGVVALRDRCPHRAAALSEGRMTPDGQLQCAYHGWSFDGQSGICTNIPQISAGQKLTGRTCATALSACERQGMIWVYPNPGAAPSQDSIPVLPELDEENWTSDDFVRDMPVDYTLLVENLLDPDHGLYAHQTPTFDSYTASQDFPMHITEHSTSNSYKLVGEVAGILKMTGKDDSAKTKPLPGEQVSSASDITARIVFQSPTMVRWSRHDKQGSTNFISAFYLLPAGFGKTRFMSRYVRSIAPKVHPPRWLVSIALNRFVDQDTYLLATQQSVTLSNELRDIADKQQPAQLQQPQTSDAQVSDRQRADGEAAQAGAPMARRSWYCHRSPTDNILVASGKWMDKAVPWMPNRYQGLLSSSLQGSAPLVAPGKREDVLDRFSCHTAICPDSMGFYTKVTALAKVAQVSTAAAAVVGVWYSLEASVGQAPATPKAVAAIAASLILSAGTSQVFQWLLGQFQYVYQPKDLQKDLAKLTDLTAHLQEEPTVDYRP
ncbi:TPA: hypothetical protein ACH3X3_013107 [Trebouxia sp. C0006]